MNSLQELQKRVDLIQGLLDSITLLPLAYIENNPASPFTPIDGSVCSCEDKVKTWKEVTSVVVARVFGESSSLLRIFNDHWESRVSGLSYRDEIMRKLKTAQSDLMVMIEVEKKKREMDRGIEIERAGAQACVKPPKVFISHKQEDTLYAQAIVNLIDFIIGADGDKVFCSSVPGYGVKQSRDIMDVLKEQFDNHRIFMVIIHSPRYYRSAVCLNEMGASWVLGTKFSSFLTKDCSLDQLRGVIGKEKICIDLNESKEMLNAHLNDFKDDLVAFFDANPIKESRWENAREQFISTVSLLSYAEEPESNETDLFEALYLPVFDEIFDLLDVKNFHIWAFNLAIDGNTFISKSIVNGFSRIINLIKSRPKNKDFASWDSLLKNLSLLLSDFQRTLAFHVVPFDDQTLIVEKFYKLLSYNPNYKRDLDAYVEYVRLISDLTFELARLVNLILTRIRGKIPTYMRDLGILFIESNVSEPDLIYQEAEVSDSPYPGIRDFISLRLTRDKHFGSSATIDIDGYELKDKDVQRA